MAYASTPRIEKASEISAMIIAGSSAKPEMKMKPKPIMMSITLWSTGPAPRSLNSGNSTAVTTIIPATRQAARKPKKITKRRPISAMKNPCSRHCEEPTGPAHLGRPDDRLRDEAIHGSASGAMDCFASLAMTDSGPMTEDDATDEISDIEARIEALAEVAERCRKFILASR